MRLFDNSKWRVSASPITRFEALLAAQARSVASGDDNYYGTQRVNAKCTCRTILASFTCAITGKTLSLESSFKSPPSMSGVGLGNLNFFVLSISPILFLLGKIFYHKKLIPINTVIILNYGGRANGIFLFINIITVKSKIIYLFVKKKIELRKIRYLA